ncbi:L-threonylcarbamoyladenylate synthase [Spiroplasma taiwanense]|uniref:L-threonylcarbamoyladenylate synthase n=1 Tax=Spiroplasma taiwanense CT-1 TaxID=1276220 RepID=S5MCV1_9MOLU|nr:Sua5/YciO/YrdC/YwlC family protein [Spiroplasma taiwanense]AGR41553.1 tRNA threonylcarbamoyladenosine biosynthesis protein [Spiroplasma taiwanense CT-1]
MLNRSEIKEIIKNLKNQKVLIIPTDTIYGISAVISKENEILINSIKMSPNNKKLIILISNLKQAKKMILLNNEIENNFLDLRPITQIISLKKNPNKNIALRMIKRKDLKKIIDKTGPIFSTSVNKTGFDFLTQKDELENFSNKIFKVYWDGELKNSPSMIIDFSKQTVIRK